MHACTYPQQVQASCPWTEHTSDNGRKYYYNTVTQTSSWEMPPEFKGTSAAPPYFVATTATTLLSLYWAWC